MQPSSQAFGPQDTSQCIKASQCAPVCCVEQKGFGFFDLCHLYKDEAKSKNWSSQQSRAEQRGGSGVSLGPSFVPHPPLCSLNPINLHPLCLLMEAAAALDQAALIYLQRRKPGVPSGPVGWRIAWLIGRTGSNCGCTLTRGGLVWKEKKYSTLYT